MKKHNPEHFLIGILKKKYFLKVVSIFKEQLLSDFYMSSNSSNYKSFLFLFQWYDIETKHWLIVPILKTKSKSSNFISGY